jgi:hypothetical protein
MDCSFAATELTVVALPTSAAIRLVGWASTSADRLSTEPLGPLSVSAFIVGGHRLVWLGLTVVASALVEWRIRWARTALVAAACHVVGTLVSEGVVAWRIDRGLLPAGARSQVDVGSSYVVAGLLGCAIVIAVPAGRLVAAGCLGVLGPPLLQGLSRFDVSAVGHLTAGSTGPVLGIVTAVSRRISRQRAAGLVEKGDFAGGEKGAEAQ